MSDNSNKIEKLAQKWADDADMESLMNFFIEKQVEYLEALSTDELEELFDENCIE